jgi:hypothetical protein
MSSVGEWFRSKKNIALTASLIGAVGVIVSLIYFLYKQRDYAEQIRKDNLALAALLKQSQDVSQLKKGIRNLELAQCASTHVSNSPALSALLQCPTPTMEGQATGPQPAPTPSGPPASGPGIGAGVRGTGASAQQQYAPYDSMMMSPGATSYTPIMPNYGYFGPFGTSSV